MRSLLNSMKGMRILAILIVLLVVGCSLFKPIELPETKRYIINQLPKDIPKAKRKHDETILVLSAIANPGFDTRYIAYINSPYLIQHYSHSLWLALPSEMVRSVIANTLKNTHYFHAVLEQPQFAKTDYRLSTRIIKLQQEFFRKEVRVRIVLQADLISNHNSKVIASRVFQEVKPLSDPSPYHAVLAFNSIMAIMAKNITRFVIANV